MSNRINPSRTARALRVDMYADWLHHDADGLAHNLTSPAGEPIEGATAILLSAQNRLVNALALVTLAIRASQKNPQKEPA